MPVFAIKSRIALEDVMKKIAGILAALTLSGCAVGIQDNGNSPQVAYEVDRPFQAVYARAIDQAEQCMQGSTRIDSDVATLQRRSSVFEVHHRLDDGGRRGEVWVSAPLTGVVVARTELQAISKDRTAVTQTVWGKGTWDGRTLHAMQQSILMDASACTVYKLD